MRKFSGVFLKMSLIFKKFCNMMKYIINIISIRVSDPCKMFWDQSCSPLDAEHRFSAIQASRRWQEATHTFLMNSLAYASLIETLNLFRL